MLPALALAIGLGACSVVLAPPSKITNRISNGFMPSHLVYCFGHGCARQHVVTFRPQKWETVRAIFVNAPAANAEAEQAHIKAAIGLMEMIAGAQAGTSGDKGRTMEFGYDLGPPQLDCYDEAINTSNFLGLLERDGLLRYHRVEGPAQRAFVSGDIIHATAVVRETASGQRFAVDSSFFDNGRDASIAPLDVWLAGWHPPELAAHKLAAGYLSTYEIEPTP
jgi:hypothetical protein